MIKKRPRQGSGGHSRRSSHAPQETIKDCSIFSLNQGPTVEPAPAFLELGLSEAAARGATAMGYTEPTEIQKQVIPELLAGHDVIACSETGSGKTAAFVLPIIDLIDPGFEHVQVVCLAPTRELCAQVTRDFRELGSPYHLGVADIYGGVSYNRQRAMLAQCPQVVVAAPGRALDLLGSGTLDLSQVRILILDEADRMLDMGFAPQILAILERLPEDRTTLLFSATIPAEIKRLAKSGMRDPVVLQVGRRATPPASLVQDALDLLASEKPAKLIELVAAEPGRVLVFTATKRGADQVLRQLENAGFAACALHADKTQVDRKKAIDGFRDQRYRVMVATDVASRGLDIEGIELVVNYDLPDNPEDYVHRVGRSARADRPGRAIAFVTYRDYISLRNIERLTGQTFKSMPPPKRSLDRRASIKRKIH